MGRGPRAPRATALRASEAFVDPDVDRGFNWRHRPVQGVAGATPGGCATAGTAKTWPHGVVRLEGQIRALTADPAFKGGDYEGPPVRGIEATSAVWLGWLYSQERT